MVYTKYQFLPAPPSLPRKYSFLAFDTENNPDTGAFICGAYYGVFPDSHGRTKIVQEYCDNEIDFRKTFLSIEEFVIKRRHRFILVGFNTAYDIVYLGDIVKSPDRLDVGSRFIQAKTMRGTKIYDVSNHVTGSLDDWIGKLKMRERYGVYKRDGYLEDEELKRQQVLDDARATWLLATWVQDRLVNEFGISMTPTKFGAALKIFRTHYFRGNWQRTAKEEWKSDLERASYYGGRCEVFARGEWAVESYDVNSMYVAIMRDELIPNPSIANYIRDEDQIRGLLETDFLTVDCRVRVPKLRVGLLPYRHPELKKLVFPWGEWRGVFNSVELREALRWGAEIMETYRALWYPESDYYFRDYAQMTLDGRRRAKEKGDVAEEQLFKYFGNGLYGKFGQRNTEGGRFIRLSQYDKPLDGLMIIQGNAADGSDAWVETPAKEPINAHHTFPVVSATITAYARAKLLNALCHNMETAIYCDTDSLKTRGHPIGIDIGDEPGQWGYEYSAEQMFYRPKLYGDKRKGVPKKAELVAATPAEEIYRFRSPVKFKSSIRRGLPQNLWLEEIKVLSLVDDKREWVSDEESWPLYVYESPIKTSVDLVSENVLQGHNTPIRQR